MVYYLIDINTLKEESLEYIQRHYNEYFNKDISKDDILMGLFTTNICKFSIKNDPTVEYVVRFDMFDNNIDINMYDFRTQENKPVKLFRTDKSQEIVVEERVDKK